MSTSCCAFHNNRTSAICCFAAEKTRNANSTKGTRNKNTTRASQIGGGTKSSQHDPQDLLPGVDFGGSVITAVDCGSLRPPEKGIISKTKEVVGRLSRVATNQNTGNGHTMSQHREEIEMVHVGAGNEIVVSYDVWRTIEEKSDANDSIESK